MSFSAVLTLAHARRSTVAAMVTEHPRHQTYAPFAGSTADALRRPDPHADARVTAIVGRGRVEAVEVTRRATARRERLACDTVVFTGDWIPDHELARRGGARDRRRHARPGASTALRTSRPGVFAAGNLLHAAETADVCALAGEARGGDASSRYLAGDAGAGRGRRARVEPPLAWVAPNRLAADAPAPPRGRLLVWAAAFASRPRATVVQDGRLLHDERLGHRLVPNRPVALDAGWLGAVALDGGPAVIRIADGGSRPKARIPVDSP